MSLQNPKVGFVSLGCPKALVDSERILTQLRVEGYDIVPTYQAADVVVVNTCGFIDAAVTESLDAIGEALAENGKVIVTGCLGKRPEQIREAHPDVLAISGPQDYQSVMEAVHAALPPRHDPFLDLVPDYGLKLTPRHYAYLKISEGCNHRCSFCIIPSMRGDLVSRPVDEVLREAERLVRGGVKELLVVSQDTSAYGVDLKYAEREWGGKTYATRMKALCEGLSELGAWTRLHYVYPYPHVDDVIPLMAEGKVLPYLDIPFQHASPRILKLMKRPGAVDKTLERVQRWRAMCPELTLRSTFIVGFPGETEAEFEALLDFLDEAQLDRVGAFAYSPVEGAAANALPDPVPEEVKQERLARFMERQAAISAARLEAKIGSVQRCLVDLLEDGIAVARSSADAPEIDGLVHIQNGEEFGLKPGQFVDVEITDSDEHDLFGDAIAQPAAGPIDLKVL
ncbi:MULTISPECIES: 30S ribosomal protein S12 methylthiotransferase RimO [Pseudoxanthomonas]|jgi:ribosomal protein S12 methylthiotransferase|uniref:30S ribosomal protein S12 methylthiotransferase RimO n=1 Tax=Pseudoxanthomonas TaxID=83618 RepID=UPI0016145237|nr:MULTISPECIES: 30S ribosomal protein S12 methylthiotransferase RimO [Pseudoxanthomonas]MBB3277206.1 ribosomal protein S12 methylthiotransferase [Pseudoxanthomonas sp. OG2]MBD9376484.1 30S ribosomal protein S12 methylthiotransferase RimO [Pseudoxanthomonas sp. PXM04]MBV7473971.1 30S ribosomal protein S12 methylthiotransferase RimO [Pseudoxanthomonas sp. PXM05]UBB26444.1 30S ribosomal protein S12 methylthiotransferase RimO [Pseudoxanthomonas japonensis]